MFFLQTTKINLIGKLKQNIRRNYLFEYQFVKNSFFRFVSQKNCINHYSHSYDTISDKSVEEELIFLIPYKMLLLHKRREKRRHIMSLRKQKNKFLIWVFSLIILFYWLLTMGWHQNIQRKPSAYLFSLEVPSEVTKKCDLQVF